jgi:hypothetical protein
MLEVVQVTNSPMHKIKNSSGRIPKELGGVYTSHAAGDKAIRLFQSVIRNKPTIKRRKARAKPAVQEG